MRGLEEGEGGEPAVLEARVILRRAGFAGWIENESMSEHRINEVEVLTSDLGRYEVGGMKESAGTRGSYQGRRDSLVTARDHLAYEKHSSYV